MMSVLQKRLCQQFSSLVQSKMTGNIIFVLLPPLAYWEFFGAYVLAAVARGNGGGAAVLLVTLPFVEIEFRHPLWIVAFAFTKRRTGLARDDRRNLVRENRPGRCLPELFIMPLTFFLGFLLDPFAPGFLARALAFQPVFLHD